MSEQTKTDQITEDFLNGLVSDIESDNLDPRIKKALGSYEQVLEQKFLAAQALEKKDDSTPEKKDIHVDDTEDPDVSDMPTPYKAKNWRTGFSQLLEDVKGHAIGSNYSPKLREIYSYQQRKAAAGHNEAIPSDGGFLVQTDMATNLMQLTHDEDSLAARAFPITISGNANGIKIPAIDETSRKDGSRGGGIQVFRLAEAGTKTSTKTKVRQVELKLEKLIGLTYMTDELLQDAAAFGSVVPELVGREFRFTTNNEMYNGTGAGQMQGIMNSGALVTVGLEAGQTTANPLLAENVWNMWSRAFARGRGQSVWHINQDVEPFLFSMSLTVGTGGAPVYMPANGISGSPFSTLMGRPIIPLEQAASIGTTGDITFVDWSQYLYASKGGIDSATSIHVKFLTDETTFRFVMRNDGQTWWDLPLTPYKGTNTLSPFVALATRAP